MAIDIKGKSMSLCDPANRIRLQQLQLQQQQQIQLQQSLRSPQQTIVISNNSTNMNSSNLLENSSGLMKRFGKKHLSKRVSKRQDQQQSGKENTERGQQQQQQLQQQQSVNRNLTEIQTQQLTRFAQYQLDPLLFTPQHPNNPINRIIAGNNNSNQLQIQQQQQTPTSKSNSYPYPHQIMISQQLLQPQQQQQQQQQSSHQIFMIPSVQGSQILRNSYFVNSDFSQNPSALLNVSPPQQNTPSDSLIQPQLPVSQAQGSSEQFRSSTPKSQQQINLQIIKATLSNNATSNAPTKLGNTLTSGNSSNLYSCGGSNPNNPYSQTLLVNQTDRKNIKQAKLPRIHPRQDRQIQSLRPQSKDAVIMRQKQSNIVRDKSNDDTLARTQQQGENNFVNSNSPNIPSDPSNPSNTQNLENLTQNSKVVVPVSTNPGQQQLLESLADDNEKKQCIRFFRFNLGQLLHILGKKDAYFANLAAKKPIKTFAALSPSQALGTKHIAQFGKNTLGIIAKVKKFMSTKGKYKYRERFNFSQSVQLRSINYDVRKRLSQLNEKKAASNAKIKDESEHSSDDESPVKNNKPAGGGGGGGSTNYQQTDLAKWKKYNKLDAKTKVFIIKGGYHDLRRALVDRGWVENPDYFSPCFDFKWTCKVQDVDYDNIQEFQVVNHFDNNLVFTSKYGLARNLRTLIYSDNIDCYEFFPRCFDLADVQEFEDFIENFKATKAESQLHKFREMLKVRVDHHESVDEKTELKIRLCNEIVARKFIDFYEQIDFIFNQDMLPCVSPEEWEIICKDEFQIEPRKLEMYLERLRNHPNCQIKNSNNNNNNHKRKASAKGNNNNNNHVQHSSNQSELLNENHQHGNLHSQPKKISKNAELLELCNQTLEKSMVTDPQNQLNGYRNIWIVKPNFLSRGRGIRCFNNLDKIMDYVVGKETQFVVQKYIENPLLINNKKFDMRQWVIIQDFCPPRIWFYDECYLRLCSVDHNIDDLNNRFVHLTNNIVQKFNKEGYQDKDDLMIRQEQFVEYLKETEGRDVFNAEILPKMKAIVINSLRCCQDQVGARKNSMEFVGYDFMIDSNYRPWLIEINSSPSMDYSTSITKDLVQRALEDTVKVVVDYAQAKKHNKKAVDTGGFKLIYKGDYQKAQEKYLKVGSNNSNNNTTKSAKKQP